jgi:hypothetical protein
MCIYFILLYHCHLFSVPTKSQSLPDGVCKKFTMWQFGFPPGWCIMATEGLPYRTVGENEASVP